MELKEIATVAGKSGLYNVLKPSRSGVILESMDNKKNKLVVGANHRVSILSEISIYTMDEEGAASLEKILVAIEKEFEGDTGLTPDSDNEEYRAFLKHILPEFDEERVYTSDIKKLINWYKIIREQAPEILQEKEENDQKETKETPKE